MGFKLSGKIKAVDEQNGTATIFDTRKLDAKLIALQKYMIKEGVTKDSPPPPEMIEIMNDAYNQTAIGVEGYDYDEEDGNPVEIIPVPHKINAINQMIQARLGADSQPKNSQTASVE